MVACLKLRLAAAPKPTGRAETERHWGRAGGSILKEMTGEELARRLEGILSPSQVEAGKGIGKAYDCDAYTVDKSFPSVVVMPRNTKEVARVVRFCHEEGIPFVARGAGTGLSGGAMAAMGGVILSTKKLTSILEIDPENRIMKAQAGAVNLKLSQAVAQHRLHFAPDPSSQSVATLGGNIAENSGGPHTLKYGVTAQHLLGVTLVAFDGSVHEIGGPVADAPGLDLLTLIAGSEGTVGIVTEAWIKLTPLPESVETLLAAFPSTRSATEAVAAIVEAGVLPAALEMLDHNIMEAVKRAFGLEFPAGARAMLLIECDGAPGATQREIAESERICREHGAIECSRAANEQERQKLWMARKKGVGALGRLAPTIVTHDGVIPRSKLPDMLDFAYEEAEKAGVVLANIFHAGDGNLHPIFCFDDRIPGKIDQVVKAGERIMEKCVELGGSVTGEHGVGVEKLDVLQLMFDDDDMRFQALAKESFHQSPWCNPCKVIPNQKGCTEHRMRWRGAAT